jgi:aldose sugar dehydrogenase
MLGTQIITGSPRSWSPIILLLIVLGFSFGITGENFLPYADAANPYWRSQYHEPIINDLKFKVEVVANGLEFPTSMSFLGPDDILVSEKNKGMVKRIVNGVILPDPLLHVNVANESERGLLGMASSKSTYKSGDEGEGSFRTESIEVFIFYTQVINDHVEEKTLANRLYKYELIEDELVNPKLLLDVAAKPGPFHNGGKVVIGPDDNVYVVVGDVADKDLLSANVEDGRTPLGSSGILRITSDGQIVNGKGILGDEHPLNMYYAYGIRNSFGMDFDPVTGNLWDTENGEGFGDEINLVEPGFNSGWRKVQGIWRGDRQANNSEMELASHNDIALVNFDGKGKYSKPELSWYENVGPTALVFINSSRYGEEYKNDMVVGDFNNGYLYHFDLSQDRTELLLKGPLKDNIVDEPNELDENILGQIFGGTSDIELGPDGCLYIISIGQGKIFRLIPNASTDIKAG